MTASLSEWLHERGGIARTDEIREAGFGRTAIERTLELDAARRVRRSWLYTAECPRDLVWAAALGGHLTCVSAARHHGLWVIDDEHCHIAVARNSAVKANRSKVRLHYAAAPLPRSRRTVVDPVINTLVSLGVCQPYEKALAATESAIRKGLVRRDELIRIAKSPPAFSRVARAASELSDSGIETIPRVRLAALGIELKQQVLIAGHHVDGLIGERLVIQFDGAEHLAEEQKRIDERHDAELQLRGYTVLRFGYWDVIDMWHYVEATILSAIAQALHFAQR